MSRDQELFRHQALLHGNFGERLHAEEIHVVAGLHRFVDVRGRAIAEQADEQQRRSSDGDGQQNAGFYGQGGCHGGCGAGDVAYELDCPLTASPCRYRRAQLNL